MSVKFVHLANLLTCGNKESQAFWLQAVKDGWATTLETFWKAKTIAKILDANPDIKIFLDSGAHSLLNAQAGLIQTGDTVKTEKKEGENVLTPDEFYDRLDPNERAFFAASSTRMIQKYVDFSFADNKDVLQYLDEYIAFVHKYKDQLMGYVNLDIIYNAERSWKNQEYMESNGLRPIPVFHHKEDYKWLRKYAEEYDYIGIGGVATGLGSHEFITFADQCFKIINEVNPDLKVHGFAVTAFNLMIRWSWYSCDSTSWVKHAAYGNVIQPRSAKNGQGFNFHVSPTTITVSDQAVKVPSTSNSHYSRQFSPIEIEKIHKWFEMVGVEVGEVEFAGEMYPVLETLLKRQRVNAYYYRKFLDEKIEVTSERAGATPFF
ncbi:MAG: hypothetical protein ACTSWQ_09175 [Candidatus Thorarchaeota archaeon]